MVGQQTEISSTYNDLDIFKMHLAYLGSVSVRKAKSTRLGT
jgi:hypothetical protein